MAHILRRRFVELSTKLLNATFNIMLNADATSNRAEHCLLHAVCYVDCFMQQNLQDQDPIRCTVISASMTYKCFLAELQYRALFREIFVQYCTRMNNILYYDVLEETFYSVEVFIVHFYPTVVNYNKTKISWHLRAEHKN